MAWHGMACMCSGDQGARGAAGSRSRSRDFGDTALDMEVSPQQRTPLTLSLSPSPLNVCMCVCLYVCRE